MSANDVKVTMDPQNPPVLSDDQKAELEALKAKTDAEIDTSYIPELSDDFWRKAVRNPFYKPKKASTTVRIDADVLAWLRAQGPGYQTRINAILRREMEDTLKR
ncbi:BrnA antitoxin family protein [Fodinicurvata sp. EGI_FJ10296]|uniref:BrnA antitoxin family protein n=1 Tax=Fodinicurvata sp. EGI_FJ10296 TaxID=3231908 RepID=UPI00345699D6